MKLVAPNSTYNANEKANRLNSQHKHEQQYDILNTIPSFFQFPATVRSRAFQTVFLLKRNGEALNELLGYVKDNSPGRKRFIDYLLGWYFVLYDLNHDLNLI